jgi:hypothetical protein
MDGRMSTPALIGTSGDSLRAWIAGGAGGDWRERYRQRSLNPP